MTRARLVVRATDAGPRVAAARAEAPQRWAIRGVDRRAGQLEAVHQLLGDGFFAGDAHRSAITVHSHARLAVRGLASTPVRPGLSTSVTRLTAHAASTLFYLPGALVPHAGSSHVAAIRIDADATARVLAASLVTPGRSAMGERGAFVRLQLRTTATVGNELGLAEEVIVEPAREAVNGPAMFGDCDVALSIIALGDWPASDPAWWQDAPLAGLDGGAQRLRSGGVAFRALLPSLGDALTFIDAITTRLTPPQ